MQTKSVIIFYMMLMCLQSFGQLGNRKGIWPVKKLSGGVLAWLSVWREV